MRPREEEIRRLVTDGSESGHVEFRASRRLLILVQPADFELAQALDEASWLSPFGADIRYPGDRPETAPGDEVRAHYLAHKVRDRVMAALDPYLSRR